jgi:hypothetical protein
MSEPQQIGTDDEQTVHRDVPTVTEHNAQMREQRPDDCIGRDR